MDRYWFYKMNSVCRTQIISWYQKWGSASKQMEISEFTENKMEFLPKGREMNFNAPNLAATWKKWKQTMNFYLTARMGNKSEEQKYSAFLFLLGEQGCEVFNTMK